MPIFRPPRIVAPLPVAPAPARALSLALPLLLLLIGACGPEDGASPARDPIASEIARWADTLAAHASEEEGTWAEIRGFTKPLLDSAAEALEEDRRLLALNRLAAVRLYLAGAAWMETIPQAALDDSATLRAAWTGLADSLAADPSPADFEAIRPAAVRALAQVAAQESRGYHKASFEFGEATSPRDGLFYIGAARAQRDFASFCANLREPAKGRPPELPSLAPALDALQGELLDAYRPPASIDRHPEFITIGSILKEARELDEAGLREGALYRALLATQRLSSLQRETGAAAADSASLAGALAEPARRLDRGRIDHSIGRLFLESAQADLGGPDSTHAVATAVIEKVLPRYFAVVEAGAPDLPAGQTAVTVETTETTETTGTTGTSAHVATITLVRWPYT